MTELNSNLKRERHNLTTMMAQTEMERDKLQQEVEDEKAHGRQLKNNQEVLLVCVCLMLYIV